MKFSINFSCVLEKKKSSKWAWYRKALHAEEK